MAAHQRGFEHMAIAAWNRRAAVSQPAPNGLPLRITLQALNEGERWDATSNSGKLFAGHATPHAALDAALKDAGVVQAAPEQATPTPWNVRMGVEVGDIVSKDVAWDYVKAELLEWRALAAPSGAPKQPQNINYILALLAQYHKEVWEVAQSEHPIYDEAGRYTAKALVAAIEELAAASTVQSAPVLPACPVAVTPDELAALKRFYECAQDGEGYDVPDQMMQRLAEIGLLDRKRGTYYVTTDFATALLNGQFALEVQEMALCESGHLILHPDVPYIFRVRLGCKECAELAAAQSTPVQVEGQQEQALQPSCDSALRAEPGSLHDDDFSVLRKVVHLIGCKLVDEEHDNDQQVARGNELIALSGVCAICNGDGQDGDAPDANGEGGWIGLCGDCKGTGFVKAQGRCRAQGGIDEPKGAIQAGALPVAAVPEQKP